MRRLNLADNAIHELVPRVFYMLNKLKYLDLSGNLLEELPADVFKDITVRPINNGTRTRTLFFNFAFFRGLPGTATVAASGRRNECVLSIYFVIAAQILNH